MSQWIEVFFHLFAFVSFGMSMYLSLKVIVFSQVYAARAAARFIVSEKTQTVDDNGIVDAGLQLAGLCWTLTAGLVWLIS